LVEDWAQLDGLHGSTKLLTVYFERNPIQKDVNYRRKIKMALPSLTQIDAALCR
jgi:protein phosphatase 1 regulatory subunit 7